MVATKIYNDYLCLHGVKSNNASNHGMNETWNPLHYEACKRVTGRTMI